MTKRLSSFGLNFALALCWLLFVWTNFKGYRASGSIGLLLSTLEASIVTLLFLVRRETHLISKKPQDIGVAFAGSFFLLLMRPTSPTVNAFLGTSLIAIGLTVSIFSLMYLGRSFGIIPAVRAIKTTGPYALVRHPMYLGHSTATIGYVLLSPSLSNIAIAFVGIALLIARIAAEESLLRGDSYYQTYMQRTKYRIIPFVY